MVDNDGVAGEIKVVRQTHDATGHGDHFGAFAGSHVDPEMARAGCTVEHPPGAEDAGDRPDGRPDEIVESLAAVGVGGTGGGNLGGIGPNPRAHRFGRRHLGGGEPVDMLLRVVPLANFQDQTMAGAVGKPRLDQRPGLRVMAEAEHEPAVLGDPHQGAVQGYHGTGHGDPADQPALHHLALETQASRPAETRPCRQSQHHHHDKRNSLGRTHARSDHMSCP